MSKVTPMLQQYLEIKQAYTECILFFRLGDFYEMFFEDAVTAAKELEIVLTARDSSSANPIPMCGIPYHAAANYLAKLLNKGYKVAICEQIEDPKATKGIVKREVVRVITPGTIIEDQLLQDKTNNYLAALVEHEHHWGLAYVDLSTGEFCTTQFPAKQTSLLIAELTRIRPAEIYLRTEDAESLNLKHQLSELTVTHAETSFFKYDKAYQCLIEHFQVQNLHGFGCEILTAATLAAGAVLAYLIETQKNSLIHLRKIITYEIGAFMALDNATRRNLELTRTMRSGEVQGSLLWVLDQTITSMGGRTLRAWIEQPLTSCHEIEARQNAVSELTQNMAARETFQESFAQVYDLQRILSKLAHNSASARDLLALKKTLAVLPQFKTCLEQFTSARLQILNQAFDPLPELTDLLEKALRAEPPLTIKEGGMIKPEFHPELEKLITASSQGKRWVTELEQCERERTGIRSLKVGFNQVFGYYIEISNANRNLVPDDYIRKQTLANGERYINQTLKEYEEQILNAHEKSITLEYQIFLELRDAVLQQIDALQNTALALAELDALISFAEIAVRNRYVKPNLNETGELSIQAGRHPVVEKMLSTGSFIPNDTLLDQTENRTQIITGPNMAGKSTYMRQIALIVLMAHLGSFVPAQAAEISLVDRIFTRVGASDDLATGQSTFMVEMNEVAYILNHATRHSLLILDEIGRGTSTFDGLSIAWAVVEFVNHQTKLGAKTLVATHYHELTELETRLAGVKNYHIAVRRAGEEIVFLRKIMPGCAAQSYGIEVARLAGLPSEITNRAKEILQTLEQHEVAEFQEIIHDPKLNTIETPGEQLSLFPSEKDLIIDELKKMNLAILTPLQALNDLYEWQQRLLK